MPTHSILLISGYEVFARNLSAWLNRHSYVLAGHCPSLESVASCSLALNSTLVLVDLETPDTADAAHWMGLTRSFPDAPLIALITAGAEAARQHATDAGVLLFLTKDSGEAGFFMNLEAALRQAMEAAIERTLKPFTAREREVLLLIAAGLTNSEIAQQLVVSQKTVKRHVSAIMEKLAVDNRGSVSSPV